MDGSLEIVEALNTVEEQHNKLNNAWKQSPKKLISANEPSFSLYYLNWLINNYDINLDFDFILNTLNNEGEITTFRFTLHGDGPYRDIYRLIMLLTENPLLYKVETFHFKHNKEDPNLLNFSLQICGFSLPKEWNIESDFSLDNIKPVSTSDFFHDAFKPIYVRREPSKSTNMFSKKVEKQSAPKPVDDGLVDIEKASLQAVANGQVYLKDAKGELITLKEGDKVHLGRLWKINQKKSEIEFTIDKDGVAKKITLGLGYKK